VTFCLGMKVHDGLVGIADTRITTGNECITAQKVSVHRHGGHSLFLMTSGLRSVRDKALTYFEETLEEADTAYDKLYKAVNAFAEQTRRVAREDREALQESNLPFNLHALVGGQLEGDREPRLYMLYPQGNWVEVSQGTPYYIIGESGYGKPILDRTLKFSDSMRFALKVGCLAFDSTRISSANVDFPIDVVLFERDTYEIVQHRYEKGELQEISNWWQERLRSSVIELPNGFVDNVFSRLAPRTPAPTTLPFAGAEAP